MMTANETYILYALLISNAFLLGAATIAVLRLQELLDKSESFWNGPAAATARHASTQSKEIKDIVDQRISSLQRVIDELAVSDRAAHLQKSGDLPFEYAVRLAKHGADIDDLTRSCGISEVEAKLMMRVHAGGDAASNTH